MTFNWIDIRKNVFGILKSPGRNLDDLDMYDEYGSETIDPVDANRFYATFKSYDDELDSFTILVAIRDEGQRSHIDVKTPGFRNDKDFNMILSLIKHIRKAVGLKEGIKVNWQDFDKTIDPREEAVNNIKESKDVGKIFGTTKSSFQRIGEAKLIIRHTSPVNEEKHGARTRYIKALFVESKDGERFAYPHLHMAGARAFARHVSNGGKNFDQVAEKIFTLSENYISLKTVAKEMRLVNRNNIASTLKENMIGINKKLKGIFGPKGYHAVSQDLINESILIDEESVKEIQNYLAEICNCSPESKLFTDIGVAARYINGIPANEVSPFTFTWNRKPSVMTTNSLNAKDAMYAQVVELADASDHPKTSIKLLKIAEMIANNVLPSDDDVKFIKEAISSSEQYTSIPIVESIELDKYFENYSLENIFTDHTVIDESHMDQVFPDTEQGAIDALSNLSTHDLTDAKAIPDPYVKGVWQVDHKNGTSIVYLKGYDDAGLKFNDFEDMDMTEEASSDNFKDIEGPDPLSHSIDSKKDRFDDKPDSSYSDFEDMDGPADSTYPSVPKKERFNDMTPLDDDGDDDDMDGPASAEDLDRLSKLAGIQK